MGYGLKDNILNLDTSSYAKEHELPEDLSKYIDCSNGINPFGFSKEVEKALTSIPFKIINKISPFDPIIQFALLSILNSDSITVYMALFL